MLSYQRSLFEPRAPPAFDASFRTALRTSLARGAWVDHAARWLTGHEQLFEALLSDASWQETEQQLFERSVVTPRLIAGLPESSPALELIERMRQALSRRYAQAFTRVSLALYRNGRDSVAFHGDRIARELPEALVATVTLGEGRRFLLRPREATLGGVPRRSVAFQLDGGDLIVMGGTCQRTWQHCIPKVSHAGARIAVMFRPDWSERDHFADDPAPGPTQRG